MNLNIPLYNTTICAKKQEKKGVITIQTITRTEIKWMLNMVKNDRDNSKALKDIPGQQYAALYALEYGNMSTLAIKLESVLEAKDKRIAVK